MRRDRGVALVTLRLFDVGVPGAARGDGDEHRLRVVPAREAPPHPREVLRHPVAADVEEGVKRLHVSARRRTMAVRVELGVGLAGLRLSRGAVEVLEPGQHDHANQHVLVHASPVGSPWCSREGPRARSMRRGMSTTAFMPKRSYRLCALDFHEPCATVRSSPLPRLLKLYPSTRKPWKPNSSPATTPTRRCNAYDAACACE